MNNLFKFKRNSLFFKILTSFLMTNILLVAFNYFSFEFFKHNIHGEIIKYNDLNLSNTVDKYESHLKSIVTLAKSMYIQDSIKDISDRIQTGIPVDSISYPLNEAVGELKALIGNPFMHVENIFLYYPKQSVIIDKNGLNKAQPLLQNLYLNPAYTIAFLDRQFADNYHHRIFPAGKFTQRIFNEKGAEKHLIPIAVKDQLTKSFYILVLLKADQIYENFHHSISDEFVIFDPNGESVFSSLTGTLLPEDLATRLSRYGRSFQFENNYYFYKIGTFSGFTYVNIIPNQNVSSQIRKLNLVLFSVLAASFVISVVISVLYSIRFNNPVKKIIADIQQLRPAERRPSKIKEFDIISEKIKDMLRKHHSINKDLAVKNAMLTQYAYINKLKMIHDNTHEDPVIANKPFYFVLFQIHFSQLYKRKYGIEQERAMGYIREFINNAVSGQFAESLTFQMETDQILSLIFQRDGRSVILETAAKLKQTFDMDEQYYFLTIAVSENHHNSSEFTDAYKQVLEMTKQRRLVNKTQILSETRPENRTNAFDNFQEQEFIVNLREGNYANVIKPVKRALGQMYKKGCGIHQFRQFAKHVTDKTIHTLNKLQLSMKGDDPEPFTHLYTIEQYEAFFEEYLTDAIELINRKKAKQNPIADFVKKYVEEHYHKNISQSMVADQLKITNRYLSTYFKENTGMNFIDYLNEYRIGKAKELLIQSNLKIVDISEKVGYLNINSFIRSFKKYTGLTPGEFRKRDFGEQ